MLPANDAIDGAILATMRITKILSVEQELVGRFLAVLGSGLVVAGHSKAARPGFFIFASNFIREYLEPEYFRKEEVLLKALEDAGFPGDDGPVGAMRREYEKSREMSRILFEAAKAWQAGDEGGRPEVIWATSEYTALMRHHFERLRNLINPLLEQTVTPEGEQKIAESLNLIAFADRETAAPEKYSKIVDMLEEELSNWQK
jgi:hemerythrin-like domain-containing protein